MYSHGQADALQCFGLEKTANALSRQIRKAVAAGDLGRANRLSRAVTSVNRPARIDQAGNAIEAASHPNSPGMYLGRVGGGSEGESVLMAHPDFGVHVLQTPNREGILTPQGIEAKTQMMQDLNSPVLPRILGTHRTGGGHLPQRRMEYIPGQTAREIQKASPDGRTFDPTLAAATARLKADAARAGHTFEDLDRPDNWVRDSRNGEWRMVDPLPVMRAGTSTPLAKPVRALSDEVRARVGRSYQDSIVDRLDSPTLLEEAAARRGTGRR